MIRLATISGRQLLLSLLCATHLVLADSDADTAQQLRQSGDILPLETILQKLQTTHPGKVLEVELEEKQSQLFYEIELLDVNGKVWELLVDPRTGAVVHKEKDD